MEQPKDYLDNVVPDRTVDDPTWMQYPLPKHRLAASSISADFAVRRPLRQKLLEQILPLFVIAAILRTRRSLNQASLLESWRAEVPGVCLDTAAFVSGEALAAGPVGELAAAVNLRLTVLESRDSFMAAMYR